jgi:hypothetical protein
LSVAAFSDASFPLAAFSAAFAASAGGGGLSRRDLRHRLDRAGLVDERVRQAVEPQRHRERDDDALAATR